MLDFEFVRAVSQLRERQHLAPTTGDVAAQLGISRGHAWRRLTAIGEVYSTPDNPAPRWYVRVAAGGPVGRVHALILEAAALVRGLDAEAAERLRAELLDALEGRR